MDIPRPAAVLFDLDGTLLLTLDDIALALEKALEKHGLTAPADIAPMVGDGARMLCSRAVGRSPEDPLVSAVLSSFLDAYAADPTPRTRLGEGAAALLAALSAKRIPVAVVTNKPGALARTIIERLVPGISVTLGGGDTTHLKPHPEPLLEAKRRLGVDGPIWMVGDGVQDVAAGRTAGAFTVLVRQGYGVRDRVEADLVIDRLDELIALL
jgi:N-acetyl-D-muramate 6-phosphate phosphatase